MECRVFLSLCSDECLARRLNEGRLKGSDFQLVKVIGRGSFGEVQLVRHTRTRQVHAMKLLNKYDMVCRLTLCITVSATAYIHFFYCALLI